MRIFSTLIITATLCGCGAEVLTTTATQSKLQAEQATAMKRQLSKSAENTGRINLERAIRTFQAERGTYPPSLDALVPEFLPALPEQADGSPWGYNPATGAVLKEAFSGPTPTDRQLIQAIHTAIDQYGQDTGYYPATLDDLAPAYLATPPRTASGEVFNYDNQIGAVWHPREPRPGAQPSASRPKNTATKYSDRQMQAVEELGF